MARTFRAPNSGSVTTIAGSIPGSDSKATWIGIATPLSTSGCVVFYKGASPDAGSRLVPFNASPGQTIILGPYFISDGISTCSITGGSAIFHLG